MIRGRVQTFVEFWPHYLAKHRSPVCRHLNFIGISGLLAFISFGIVVSPAQTSLSVLTLLFGVSVFLRKVEAHRPAPRVFAMLMLAAIAVNPAQLAPGLVFAYFFSWIGHDQLEGNRRTLLSYPGWSLLADFRLYFLMLRGRLWTRSSFARAEF